MICQDRNGSSWVFLRPWCIITETHTAEVWKRRPTVVDMSRTEIKLLCCAMTGLRASDLSVNFQLLVLVQMGVCFAE